MNRPEHKPAGDPCDKCGLAASIHRVRAPRIDTRERSDRKQPEHVPQGDPCYCGVSARLHRKRGKREREYAYRYRPDKTEVRYIGIDGEGIGGDGRTGDHRYIYLAAADDNNVWDAEAPTGGRLTTEQCLDLILELPSYKTKVFSYSFNYDLTKILTDLPDQLLYYLFRPHLRHNKVSPERGPIPVCWGDYELNLLGTKFSVKRGKRRTTVWDLFRFYGTGFVKALLNWKIGSAEELERMTYMKSKRNEFNRLSFADIKAYCVDECRKMASLGRKLVESHEAAGLKLTSYYGAGSSGAAMLRVMGIKERLVPIADEMKEAVASAFFGGRFENSVAGPVKGPVYGWDINSAYPYQLYLLPCLEHGTWELTTDRKAIDDCTTALVQYSLDSMPVKCAWGPLPFRTRTGTILYPLGSKGGWVWRSEYLAAERYTDKLRFRQAWVYRTMCDCRPFSRVPEFYLERLRLGSDGAGLVIKLGLNSEYGKLAQSVGNAPYNNWIWAGLITAGCRAQLLELIALHKDPSNVLMVATDGLYTREVIVPPKPLFTGTDIEVNGKRKPLGGWDGKVYPQGMFCARPGVYFPTNPTDKQLEDVRARGLGKAKLLEHWRDIVDAFAAGKTEVHLPDVARFCGAKTSVHLISRKRKLELGLDSIYRRTNGRDDEGNLPPDGERARPAYGQWIMRPHMVGFSAMPKRVKTLRDGRLVCHDLNKHGPRPANQKLLAEFGLKKEPTYPYESMPYRRASSDERAPMRASLRKLRHDFDIATEQPDGGDITLSDIQGIHDE